MVVVQVLPMVGVAVTDLGVVILEAVDVWGIVIGQLTLAAGAQMRRPFWTGGRL